jgi:Flp pilus assembly protein TadD
VTIHEEGTALWINVLCQQRRSVLLLATALSCQEINQHQTAVSLLELCVQLEPDNSDVQLLLGQSLMALGQLESATKALEQTVALALDCDEAKSLLLWCYTSV